MKILISCFCLLSWMAFPCFGQQTITIGGGAEESGTFTIEWSLGDWVAGPIGSEMSLQYGTIQPALLVIPLSTEDELPVQISIYPNPTAADVLVELHQNRSTIHYRLLTLKGEQLQAGTLKSGEQKLSIALRDYSSGIYHLILSQEQGPHVYSYKILKNQ